MVSKFEFLVILSVAAFIGVVSAERECPALDCTDLENGEYPNPEDCASFCYCVWGESVWTDCPAGLHFNAKKKSL